MQELEIEVWYENHEGEVKSVKQVAFIKKGDSPTGTILEIARNGFRIKTVNRGIYRFIPPTRVLSITYPE